MSVPSYRSSPRVKTPTKAPMKSSSSLNDLRTRSSPRTSSGPRNGHAHSDATKATAVPMSAPADRGDPNRRSSSPPNGSKPATPPKMNGAAPSPSKPSVSKGSRRHSNGNQGKGVSFSSPDPMDSRMKNSNSFNEDLHRLSTATSDLCHTNGMVNGHTNGYSNVLNTHAAGPSSPTLKSATKLPPLEYIRRVCNLAGLRVMAAVIFATIGVNVLAGFLYLTVCPWSPERYRRILSQYCAKWWVDAIAICYPHIRISVTGDSDMLGALQPSIILCNHQIEGDWWHVLMVARCVGLHGNMKIVLKRELRDIPLVGLLLWWLDFPTLARGSEWQEEKPKMTKMLETFSEERLPVQVLLFPEGTVCNQTSIANSLKFAAREGRPKLKLLLLPHKKGFYTCLDSLKSENNSPVVYDMTMTYQGYAGDIPVKSDPLWQTVVNWFFGQVPREVHVRIKRFSMEEVMSDSHWLDSRWAEKDKILTHFKHHHQFPSDGRGFEPTTFDSSEHRKESSVLSLVCLSGITIALPLVTAALIIPTLLLSPLIVTLWLARRVRTSLSGMDTGPTDKTRSGSGSRSVSHVMYDSLMGTLSPSKLFSFYGGMTPASASVHKGSETVTPGLPPTPFASPLPATGLQTGVHASYR